MKELQLKLMEDDSGDMMSLSRPQATFTAALCAQIEAESREKEVLIRENRRLERSIQDLHSRLSAQDQGRISLEESLSKHEIRQRKVQTRLDELEQSLGEAEFGKKRSERDLGEAKEEIRRLSREMDRLKSRSLPAATGLSTEQYPNTV